MTPASLLFRRARIGAIVLVLLVGLALGGCSDDDGDDEGGSDTTAPADEPTEGTVPDTGFPVSDGVAIEIAGSVEQTFRGGACVADQGYVQVLAGYATGVGPNRPQGSPFANATATLIIKAEEGESDEAILNLVRESDGEFLLAETPSVVVDPGLATGTFESDAVSGSWTCPQVLTAEQFQDLQADYAAE